MILIYFQTIETNTSDNEINDYFKKIINGITEAKNSLSLNLNDSSKYLTEISKETF